MCERVSVSPVRSSPWAWHGPSTLLTRFLAVFRRQLGFWFGTTYCIIVCDALLRLCQVYSYSCSKRTTSKKNKTQCNAFVNHAHLSKSGSKIKEKRKYSHDIPTSTSRSCTSSNRECGITAQWEREAKSDAASRYPTYGVLRVII